MVFAKIYVTGTCARVTELKKLTASLVGGKILVDYDDHIWAGLNKTVVFRGIVEKDVLTGETTVEIPWEVVEKPCKRLWVGFYGTNSDRNMIIPTVYADLGPVLPGADPSGDESTDPSLPVWAQLQEQIDDLKENGSPGGGGYVVQDTAPEDTSVLWVDPTDNSADELPDVDLTGVVKSVNGQLPDKNGNVELEIPDSGGNVNYGAENAGKLLYVGSDGKATVLALGAGLAIENGVLILTGGGGQGILVTDDGEGNVTVTNVTVTDDGNGNVVVTGNVTVTDDGNGNVTLK